VAVYAKSEDMTARFTERILAQVTDENGQEIKTEALEVALADASAEVDSYLTRFVLPLRVVPVVLTKHVCNIALYNLLNLRPAGDLEDARKRYKDALAFLGSVRDGDLDLGLSTSNETPDRLPAIFDGPERVFSMASLRDF